MDVAREERFGTASEGGECFAGGDSIVLSAPGEEDCFPYLKSEVMAVAKRENGLILLAGEGAGGTTGITTVGSFGPTMS